MKTPRQINAGRKQAGDPPLNFKLLRKIIKRIEAIPESHAQQVWGTNVAEFNSEAKDLSYGNGGKVRPAPPCGTVACIAGETIICNAPSVRLGLLRLKRMDWLQEFIVPDVDIPSMSLPRIARIVLSMCYILMRAMSATSRK